MTATDHHLTADDLALVYGADAFDGLYADEPLPVPDDSAAADRHLLMARRAQAQRDELAALFDAQIARLQERRAEVLAPLDREIDRRLTAVEQWHRRELAAGRAPKTIKLPHGTSKLTAAQPEIEFANVDEFVAWCEEHGQTGLLLPPKPPAPSKAEIKKRLLIPDAEPGARVEIRDPDTGQPVPGLAAVHRHANSKITPEA